MIAATQQEQFQELHGAGREAARSARVIREFHARRTRHHVRDLSAAIAQKAAENARWIIDNVRVIRTAAGEARQAWRSFRHHPGVIDGSGAEAPRPYAVARQYLDEARNCFSEDGLAAFLHGYQEYAELEMGEIWAMKPALQLVLLERLAEAESASYAPYITSLRQIGEASWKDLFESVSVVDRVLAGDPAGAYPAMDYESRDAYRKTIAELAKHSGRPEHEVAQAAVELARGAARVSRFDRASRRREHVGFYLIDRGLAHLRDALGYRAPLGVRVRDYILENPNGFYLIGVELVTFIIVIGLLTALDALTPVVFGFLLLVLPATQAAVEFMNHLATALLPPRVLPKLDFAEGVPEDCATLVAVPTLLLNEGQVRDLLLDLEIRFLANRDRNIYFALLTDSPDSKQPPDSADALVNFCARGIEELNRRYDSGSRTPFYLFHRHRIFNPSEGRWMGWERKRGKLLDLNQYTRGGFDSFPVKIGDLSVMRRLRYVITLDSDTQLPRGAAARLIGAIAHPLNRAVVDPLTRMVVEGYGILQPRIGISVESASRSRLAAIYSGQTGFDIYTRAVSDVYQDLYGEGIFTGKGIYEIDVFLETLQARFPENALLSHDLIEGAYARAGLVSDIELIDDYPSHFSAYSRRRHRWVRGDWQILRWLWGVVPDYHRRLIPNPISLVSQWKIVDNLRRSLIEPNTLALFLAGWLYLPGGPLYWTAATLGLLFMPVYAGLLFSFIRAPWGKGRLLSAWAIDTATAFARGHVTAVLSVLFLLHQALLSIDAIVRSMLRVFVTRRRLLEWETAAEAEAEKRRKATVDIYLEWTPLIAAVVAMTLWALHPQAFSMAAPVLILWFVSRGVSDWLNRPPRARNRTLSAANEALLNDSAERIWRFFHDWSTPATNWLIPDSVREDGATASRISPTNLGLLLNARIAAVHFGLLGLREFAFETRQGLDRLHGLEKYCGHMLNWYDTETLEPLEPRFVSTVDSGNLVACLWTLKQAALAFARETKYAASSETAADLCEIANICNRLVSEMDFRFLYQPRKKVLSVGYNVTLGRLEKSSYDLMASESRIASFVAVAKGDVPQESWFHLGRAHTLCNGDRILASWTGTMFEYFMPALWMRHYPGTILERTAEAVVRAQREFGRQKSVPWGVSESACLALDGGDYGYGPFGIPALAMKAVGNRGLVISPYSTFLAMSTEPRESIENLRRMEEYGWSGRYGFYDAVDYSRGGGEPIRSWMAHHQGMSLLALCNVLFKNPMQRYFHSEPHVMATELLLHERLPSSVIVEPEEAFWPALPLPETG